MTKAQLIRAAAYAMKVHRPFAVPQKPFQFTIDTRNIPSGRTDYSYQFWIAVRGSLYVDFGDGETYANNTFDYGVITHNYATPGIYQITVVGQVLQIILGYHHEIVQSDYYAYALTQINTPLPGSVQILTLDRCSYLTSIPKKLFWNCSGWIDEYSGLFYGCSSLAQIPQGLFDRAAAAISFDSVFRGCTSLTSIPSGLFDHCQNVETFEESFFACTGITGAVPELWLSHPNASGRACFRYCTNAANYASIPSGWR